MSQESCESALSVAVALQLSLEVLSVCEASKVDGTALNLADVLHFEGCVEGAMHFHAFVKCKPHDSVNQRQSSAVQTPLEQ